MDTISKERCQVVKGGFFFHYYDQCSLSRFIIWFKGVGKQILVFESKSIVQVKGLFLTSFSLILLAEWLVKCEEERREEEDTPDADTNPGEMTQKTDVKVPACTLTNV